MEGVRSVALGLWIGAGSRQEPLELGGISHFIEHLIFKGSERYTAWDIARIFDDIGGEPNASTSKEHTLVTARFLDDDIETAFEVLAEMIAQPSFADLDQERQVVLEEVAMYEDSPPELIHDDLCKAVFGDHPLGRPILGQSESLTRIDLPTVRAYHGSRYVGSRIVVAAAGAVDHDRICACADRFFEQLPASVSLEPEPPAPAARHVAHFSRKETEQYHICLGGRAPERGNPDRYAVFVVDTLLGGSLSSRLFQEVREKRGLAYSVYSYTSFYNDAGLAAVYVGSREEAVEEAVSVIFDVLRSLPETIAEEAVLRAKNHLKGQLVLGMESSSNRMQSLGRAILTEQPVLSLDQVLQRIDEVTHGDVVEAAARYYNPDTWSAACIGPRAEPFWAVTDGFTWEEE